MTETLPKMDSIKWCRACGVRFNKLSGQRAYYVYIDESTSECSAGDHKVTVPARMMRHCSRCSFTWSEQLYKKGSHKEVTREGTI